MKKKILNNGFEQYYPDRELEVTGKRKCPGNEDYGHKLADIIMGDNKSEEFFYENFKEKPNLKKILKYSPKQLKFIGNQRTKLKGELGRIKRAGYDMGTDSDLTNLGTEKLWNLYISSLKSGGYFDKN